MIGKGKYKNLTKEQSQDILKIDGKLVANPHFKFRMCNDCRINKRELDL